MQDNNNGVYVIMTSNDVSQLPPELTRAGRIDATWFFDLPNDEARTEILKIHFSKFGRTLSDDVMEAAVAATEHYTGAEIETAVKAAMRKAFVRIQKSKSKLTKKDIALEDILAAIEEVTPVYKSYNEKIRHLQESSRSRARFTDGTDKKDSSKDDFFDPLSSGVEL